MRWIAEWKSNWCGGKGPRRGEGEPAGGKSKPAAFKAKAAGTRPQSSEVNILIMPGEKLLGWIQTARFRQDDWFSVSGVVFNAVLEFFFNPAAYFQAIFGRDGDIAPVKQCVHILAKQNSVRHGIGSTFAIRFDMRRIKYVQDRRTGEGASSLVGVSDEHAEGTLSQPGK